MDQGKNIRGVVAKHKTSTIRRGVVGENLVQNDLLLRNHQVFTPVVDDFGIDILCLVEDTIYTIQVKAHNVIRGTSIAIGVEPTSADIIAVPFEGQVAYFRNERKQEKYKLAISVRPPKNYQVKNVRLIKDCLEFPC